MNDVDTNFCIFVLHLYMLVVVKPYMHMKYHCWSLFPSQISSEPFCRDCYHDKSISFFWIIFSVQCCFAVILKASLRQAEIHTEEISYYLKLNRIKSPLPFMKMVYGNGEILFPCGNETTMLGYHDFLRILGSREVFSQTRSLELLGFADFQNVSTCFKTIWACFCTLQY